jgi:uroporphyrin-III C-methyltransferase
VVNKKSAGKCLVVGAGPGDLGLVTLRAKECIEQAEVIVYDYLSNPEMLKWAPESAEIIYVGKKAGAHTLSQDEINALLVEKAQAGKQVVRLKGGDPFVFGRGGEEALALQHAGIPYDVVPGISSAIAAPASAGIPVTHRGVASAFLVVSGHEEEAFASAIAQLQPNGVTIVVLMGLGRSAAIASLLIDRGWSRGTPAAIVVDASNPQQQVWRGTIDQLAADAVEIDGTGAGTIVIGDVVTVGLQSSADAGRAVQSKRSRA